MSWPVARERRRAPDAETPEPGLLRQVDTLDGERLLVAALDSVRLSIEPTIKRARTCDSGHFVGNMRTEPHAPPWHMEFRADRVQWRTLES